MTEEILLKKDEEIASLKELLLKNEVIIKTFRKWKDVSSSGKILKVLLDDMGYSNVAIYGYGHIGKALVNELASQGVNIVAIIDKNASLANGNIPLYSPEDIIDDIELTIVTSEYYYLQIRQNLIKMGHKEAIYSLDELLEQM